MGIEPTWDFVEPHAGFEDQDRHQPGKHLQTTVGQWLSKIVRFNC